MDVFGTIIFIIIIALIGWAIITFLKDPILMLKSFLRGLKGGSIRLAILSFPIWGFFWLIDKALNLGIFIKTIEEASEPYNIEFSKYEKYILLNETDLTEILKVFTRFNDSFDKEEYNYSIAETLISFSLLRKETIIKLTGKLEFETFKHLINLLSNHQNGKTLYSPIGIMIGKHHFDSFYLYKDLQYDFELVGRNKLGYKKIYSKLDLGEDTESVDKIFYNSNFEISKGFDFDKFIGQVGAARFEELKILPNL